MSATLRTSTFERLDYLLEVKSCALNSANSPGCSQGSDHSRRGVRSLHTVGNRTPALGRSASGTRRGAQAGRVLSVSLHKRRGSSQPFPESNTNP
jgi:hypothetical protein